MSIFDRDVETIVAFAVAQWAGAEQVRLLLLARGRRLSLAGCVLLGAQKGDGKRAAAPAEAKPKKAAEVKVISVVSLAIERVCGVRAARGQGGACCRSCWCRRCPRRSRGKQRREQKGPVQEVAQEG